MEAGNRCFDWSVPEEKNRNVIDHISDWLFPYTARSRDHLVDEGIARAKIFVSGNPITDVLEQFRPGWESSDALGRLGLEANGYLLVTAHRQETVDVPRRLAALCAGLNGVAAQFGRQVLWSVHPRTAARLDAAEIELDPLIRLAEPFGFLDFVALEAAAACVVTDSGTVQRSAACCTYRRSRAATRRSDPRRSSADRTPCAVWRTRSACSRVCALSSTGSATGSRRTPATGVSRHAS